MSGSTSTSDSTSTIPTSGTYILNFATLGGGNSGGTTTPVNIQNSVSVTFSKSSFTINGKNYTYDLTWGKSGSTQIILGDGHGGYYLLTDADIKISDFSYHNYSYSNSNNHWTITNTTNSSSSNLAFNNKHFVTCFLSGSEISTADGTRAVEKIQIGDQLVAFDWKHNTPVTRRVVWAGKAHATAQANLPDDEAGWPVRILKDALADGVPYKDMLITAEHCLFFNGKFVPARMLVNGVSIFYDKTIPSYDYYHVETEEHSVITADGVLTESYLDTGNRLSFRQDGKVATLRNAARTWQDDAAAPLEVDRAFVEPLFDTLKMRAASLKDGSATVPSTTRTQDPDLHLVTQSGAVIRPMRQDGPQYSFMLPPGTQAVHIVSRASRPADVIGPFVDDRRYLGVAVSAISSTSAKQQHTLTAHLQAQKPAGWHEDDQTNYAWTNGNALLPLGNALEGETGGVLVLTLAAAGPYLLDAPTTSEMTRHSA
ncbi:Hint domain-containing protein [Acetobacter malorum]|uniref:Hint domain-containing protein n=1 Tax=Acetobacter malorum TaxID=178901 RepID=UPI000A38072A